MQYEAFEQYCEAFSIKDKEIIVMMCAYFDESYNERTVRNANDPLVYTVGCCLSNKEQWMQYNEKWKVARDKYNLECFHMTDYENRKGPYAKWPEGERVPRLQAFHQIMKDSISFNCISAVNCADFDTLKIKRNKVAKLDYYGFNVIVCMDQIVSWCNKNKYDGQIHYMFSHLKKQGSFLDKWFAYCNENSGRKKIYRLNGTWSKGMMKAVQPLQAADILAYEMNKRAANEYGENGNFIRRSLTHLDYDKRKLIPLYYGTPELKKIFASGDIAPFVLEP